MKAYFISGLGADWRAFQKIKLPDNFTIIHIEWIAPLQKETLPEYSVRLSAQINTAEPFILVGLSFGGMIVSELTNRLNPLKSIIISSASSRKELPLHFKIIGKTGLNKWLPSRLLKMSNPFVFQAFGARTIEEKKLLTQILKDADPKYLKWAINAIVNWQNKEKPKNLIHIHGTKDLILPIRYTEPNIIIEGGRHFMVLSFANAINQYLERELSNL